MFGNFFQRIYDIFALSMYRNVVTVKFTIYFDISDTKVSGKGISCLTNLKVLNLQSCTISIETMESLPSSLRVLQLSLSKLKPTTVIKSLPNLIYLKLQRTNITECYFPPQLQFLIIRGC